MSEEKELKRLQKLWYQRLLDEGFRDIEEVDLPGQPLKDWHSFKFISSSSQRRSALHLEYQKLGETFLNSEDLEEICGLVVKHKNRKLQPIEVKAIFGLHLEGGTERRIAMALGSSKSTVHRVLERIRAWMKLV